MTTANELIEAAALKLGAKATGETLTASEASDALNILNSMLENWATKRLMVYQIVQSSYTWAAGASHTIGPAGDFNATRPIRIEEGTHFRDATGIDIPVEIIRNRSTYDAIASKADASTYPAYLFYDPAYPLGVLYAYPAPSASITLRLNTWQTLQSFASLTTDLALPPGYRWAIEHNLAMALEPVFSMPAPASVAREAKSAMSDLMRVNHVPVTGATEVAYVLGGGARADILAGG